MKASKFQFVKPYLVELNFVANPDFDTENTSIEMQNSFSVQINRSENENLAKVELTLESNMKNDDVPFRVKATVASEFKWEDLDEKSVESMLNLNAPALLLGYMRPIVANVTNSSCFPAYNLPFINFTE